MDKTKTSNKRKKYSLADLPNMKPNSNLELMDHDPMETLKDKKLVMQAVVECLMEGDKDALFEIIETHFRAINAGRALKAAKLSKTTFYEAIKKRETTTSTLFKMFKGMNFKSMRVAKVRKSTAY